MRIVIDTNVLIAAFIAQGRCADLFEHCVLRHTIVLSDAILSELRRHLVGKFQYSVEETEEALALVRSHAETVAPDELERPVCRDPDDDWVLATAIAGNAKCIVTGDKDLLVLQEYKTVRVIAPVDFARIEVGEEHSQ